LFEVEITPQGGTADTSQASGNVYNASNLAPATAYTWRVRAKSDDGATYSDWAAAVNFTTEAIAVPTELAAEVDENFPNRITFTWEGNATEYELAYTPTDGEEVILSEPVTSGYTKMNLAYETEYTWKVRAKVGEYYSDWVDGPAVTTGEDPNTPPVQPEGATVVLNIPDSDPVTWSAGEFLAYVDYVGDPNNEIEPSLQLVFFQISQTDPYPRVFAVAGGFANAASIVGEYTVNENGYVEYGLDSDNNSYYPYSGTVEITQFANGKVSGTISAILQYNGDGANVPLSVTFFNVPVTDVADL
jgi:hypothetical protein